MLLPLLAAVPAVAGRRGRPRRRPREVYADRAYRSRAHRRTLAARGIRLRVAAPGAPHGSGLGTRRWMVERTFAWLSQCRRLSKDYERLPATSETLIYTPMSRLMLRRLARS